MGQDRDGTCFVISPIGEANSDIRKASDQLLKFIIVPSALACGFKADAIIRADKIDHPGIITNQIITHILNCDLVVADLSGHNPNVFYELAVRHAAGKPTVLLIREGESVPFDISQNRIIFYDIHDLDKVEENKEQLINQMTRALEVSDSMDNPIKQTINLNSLASSQNPSERVSADMLASLGELRSQLTDINRQIKILSQITTGRIISSAAPPVLLGGSNSGSTASANWESFGTRIDRVETGGVTLVPGNKEYFTP